jgi:peptidyl-prolyl cis-trans isomerase B (cyclophilin B)
VSKAAKRERQRLNREARREYEERVAKRRRTLRSARRIAIFASPVLIVLIVLAITNSGGSSSSSASSVRCQTVKTPPAKSEHLTAPPQGISSQVSYTATMRTTCGTIVMTLDAAHYPKAVNNFAALANQGFYANLSFVRAAKGFVVQAGGPDQTNASGPGYTVQAETPTTQAGQSAYPIGTVAFAKSGSDPAGSAGSQFFIVTGNGAKSLPTDYAVIGTVTKGLNVAQKIESFAPASGDGPLTKPVVIQHVTIASGSTPPSS